MLLSSQVLRSLGMSFLLPGGMCYLGVCVSSCCSTEMWSRLSLWARYYLSECCKEHTIFGAVHQLPTIAHCGNG